MDMVKLQEIITKGEQFVITTHANPDGDAIGSVIGFYNLLKSFEKEAQIISHSPLPEYLAFADPERRLQHYHSELHDRVILEADVIVCLDFNAISRVQSMEAIVRKSPAEKICVDHHQMPEPVFSWIYSDTLASSTCELVYRIIKSIRPEAFTKEGVQALYLGLVTDTGSFRFDRTTPEVHKIAAHLIELGADPMVVTRNIYETGSLGKIKAVGEMINTMQIHGTENEIAVIIITKDMLKNNGMSPDDTEGFEQYMMMIKSVKVGIKVVELMSGFKASLRSKGDVPVHLLAKIYGGGGHKNAAGIPKQEGGYNKFISEIVETTKEFLKNLQ